MGLGILYSVALGQPLPSHRPGTQGTFVLLEDKRGIFSPSWNSKLCRLSESSSRIPSSLLGSTPHYSKPTLLV